MERICVDRRHQGPQRVEALADQFRGPIPVRVGSAQDADLPGQSVCAARDLSFRSTADQVDDSGDGRLPGGYPDAHWRSAVQPFRIPQSQRQRVCLYGASYGPAGAQAVLPGQSVCLNGICTGVACSHGRAHAGRNDEAVLPANPVCRLDQSGFHVCLQAVLRIPGGEAARADDPHRTVAGVY